MFPSGTGITPEPDAYSALRIDWAAASTAPGGRLNVFLRVFGRLKPGASYATAQSQLDALGEDLRSRFPILKAANTVWRTQPMAADIVKEVRPAILALMGAVMFVLLIACANVANLLLVRAAARDRELAVRAALGGSRNTLIAQMLAESVVLALAGAALGLFLAQLGIELLLRIAPANLPRVADVSIDPIVLAFTLGVSLISALIFGTFPRCARRGQISRRRFARADARPAWGAASTSVKGVVVAEVALSFVLLIGSGLMLRSFVALAHVDPGFDPTNILTFTAFNPRLRGNDERLAYENTLTERLKAIPGVIAVTAAGPLPLDGQRRKSPLGTAGSREQSRVVPPSDGIRRTAELLRGDERAASSPVEHSRWRTTCRPRRSIIIDELLAAKAFPNQSPASIIGKQLLCRIVTPEAQTVSDRRHRQAPAAFDPRRGRPRGCVRSRRLVWLRWRTVGRAYDRRSDAHRVRGAAGRRRGRAGCARSASSNP